MQLTPTLSEHISRARADLRMGLPVMIGDHIAASVETLSADRLAAIRNMGVAELAITARRAETLKARVYDGDIARIVLPKDADLAWLQALADPAGDLMTPMKGPFQSVRGGSAMIGRIAIALAKSAQLLPAMLIAAVPDQPALTQLPMAESLAQLAAESALTPVAAARLPLAAAMRSKLHVFRPDNGETEHYAIEIGDPDRQSAPLVRLHSACFTGDVLGSLKCDCGPQLHAALDAMGTVDRGVLLYLNQEGRGIGLANKMRAYALQNQGFDTVEANHRLGFEDDERDFRLGAGILREMGFSQVRLLTNNPRKVEMLQSHGIAVVERVPLIVPTNPHNRGYLAIKAEKSGHIL